MSNQRAFISRQPTSNPQVSVPAVGHTPLTEPSPTGSSLYSITYQGIHVLCRSDTIINFSNK